MVHFKVFSSYLVYRLWCVQDVDGPGDYLGPSGIARLRLNGADLGELVDFGSRGPCSRYCAN